MTTLIEQLCVGNDPDPIGRVRTIMAAFGMSLEPYTDDEVAHARLVEIDDPQIKSHRLIVTRTSSTPTYTASVSVKD